MIQEIVHHREHACIIARCSYNHRRIAERILDHLSHILATQIAHHNFLDTFLSQHLAKALSCSSCATMNAGIGYQDALALGLVFAPGIVELHSLCQGLTPQHRSMQRTDSLYIQRSHLFDHTLHL